MPYIDIGSGDDLILEIPTRRTEGWNDNVKNNLIIKIVEHDHTGTGKGRQITGAAIEADTITGAKLRLANNESLRARNQAGSADVNLLKLTTSNKLSLETDISQINLINDTYLKARNAADSAYINMIKVNSSNELESGGNLRFANLTIKQAGEINVRQAAEITNNVAVATDVTGLLLSAAAGRGARVHYSIYRDGTTDLMERGVLSFGYNGTAWQGPVKEYEGDNAGLTFTITAGGQVQYTSTNQVGHVSSIMYFFIQTVGS